MLDSQGGVKVPTGGNRVNTCSPRALLVVQVFFHKQFAIKRTSRLGEIPRPTVTVWLWGWGI